MRYVAILLITVACGPPRPAQPTTDVVRTLDCTEGVAVPLSSNDTLYVDRTPVTVTQFAAFAKTSGYVTQAEAYGNSGVFDIRQQAWTLVDGAYYRQPFGKTAGDAPADHPATQVSYHDAVAYCAHYGKRLPTETEWEAAARFAQPDGQTQYPWGDGIRDSARQYRANVWQGIFPIDQRVEDGYAYTSPVEAFAPAPSGLFDMAGNVWEWTSDTLAGSAGPGEDVHRVAKGGSFLCEPSWCHGYLIDGSTHVSGETGLFHVGFRCVCEDFSATE